MTRLGIFVRALIVSAIIALPFSFGLKPASANYMLGVPHTHLAGCTNTNCWRWILANGAVMQGPTSELQAQYGYVLVVCSQKFNNNPGGWHVSNLGPWGPYNNDGKIHPYCVSPYDAQGVRWNLYPG